MSKKVKIHTNLKSYQEARNRQTLMQEAIDTIVMEALKVGVEISDFRFIENSDPVTLIKDAYWKANKFPAGVTIDKALANTEFNQGTVEKAYNSYKQLGKSVKPLKITEDSVEITVKEEDYDWFLNDDKKELYKALEKFIKASEELNEYTNVNVWSLQRAITGDGTLVTNGKLTINPYTFKA